MTEQVMCIRDDVPPASYNGETAFKGQIYTIRDVVDYPGETPGYRFYEICCGPVTAEHDEACYESDFFTPIRDENLEIFRAMDRKIFKRKKIDA